MIEFSTSAKNMRPSEIRRLLKIASDPLVISFSGGMPNNELFLTDLVAELYNNLPLPMKQAAFQYCPTDGYPPFLGALKSYLKSKGLPVAENRLIVTAGAQQAINLVSKVLIDPGDTILTEYPCFIGAIAAFKSYGAKLVGIKMDSEGIIIKDMENALTRGDGASTKILYVSPYFHNPAGIIYSHQRKIDLLRCLTGRQICLMEDDPYGEIYFEENTKEMTLPMIVLKEWSVPICYIGSLSKVLIINVLLKIREKL
jgi:DNA-binding transcriptional MocR family regulator